MILLWLEAISAQGFVLRHALCYIVLERRCHHRTLLDLWCCKSISRVPPYKGGWKSCLADGTNINI